MVDDDMLIEIGQYGFNQTVHLFDVEEERIYKAGGVLDEDDPAHFLGVFNRLSPEARELSKYGYAAIQATIHLAQHLTLSRREIAYSLDQVQLKPNEKFPRCPLDEKKTLNCQETDLAFRSADGSCNNLDHPEWGSSLMPHLRFLPPAYGDGIQSVRKAKSGLDLPSPRQVSSSVHVDSGADTPIMTMMVMQWGQFTSHDVSFTPMARGFNNTMIKCCNKDGNIVEEDIRHPECFPVQIPADDKFFSKYNVTCMEMVRSVPSPRPDCSLGPREQLNQATSFMDASSVYGSTSKSQMALRKKEAGLMAVTEFGLRKSLLPPLDWSTFKGECRVSKPNIHCFAAGDSRANEVPGLTSMHTIWMREHNRIATELALINPHWEDERLYQESRKIVGAMNQHITYNEWLPIILGETVLDIFDLKLLQNEYAQDYNTSINPTFENAVGVAAFRFGHSQIRNTLTRCTKDFKELPVSVALHKELNDPTNMFNPGSLDRIVMGLVTKTMSRTDEFLADEVTNHLFQMPSREWGMDLAAINIQRGREHGIPPYNQWRRACGLNPFKSWADMVSATSPQLVDRLTSVYEDVDDVDLFTGGLSEKPVPGGVLGPTFACLMGQQFLNIKRGDRFWYENGGHPGAFSPAQLQEIRKTSLARVVCDNLDNIDKIQPYVFISHLEKANSPITCKGFAIPGINLKKWRETLQGEEEGTEEEEDRVLTRALYSNILEVLDSIDDRSTGRGKYFSNELPQKISPNRFYDFFKFMNKIKSIDLKGKNK